MNIAQIHEVYRSHILFYIGDCVLIN